MAQVKLGDVAVESRETYKGDKTGMPIVGLGAYHSGRGHPFQLGYGYRQHLYQTVP